MWQALGLFLIYYTFAMGAIALTLYVGSVCLRFLRESRKQGKKE